MKKFNLNQKIKCIYCCCEQEFPAQDYIPFHICADGTIKGSKSIQQEKCDDCDGIFFLKLKNDNEVIVANTPGNLLESEKMLEEVKTNQIVDSEIHTILSKEELKEIAIFRMQLQYKSIKETEDLLYNWTVTGKLSRREHTLLCKYIYQE